MPQKWALLCGGDYYAGVEASQTSGSSPTRPKNLKGCVNDVIAMKVLLTSFGVPPENIRTLTATSADGSDNAREQKNRWPTRSNIYRELLKIQNEADGNSEDTDRLLYFHYSGHGTFLGDNKPESSNDDFRGTALVMTDVASGGLHLTGRRLGIWIRRLVKKSGFRVTVVLDSCFSGDGFRDDTENDPEFEPRLHISEPNDKAKDSTTVDEADEENFADAEGGETTDDDEVEEEDTGYEEEDELIVMDDGVEEQTGGYEEEEETTNDEEEQHISTTGSKRKEETTSIADQDEKVSIVVTADEVKRETAIIDDPDEDDTMMATTDEENAEFATTDDYEEENDGERDGTAIRKCWFAEPKGCVVITACSRRQTAGERLFDDKSQGILTHWLIATLTDLRKDRWPSYARTVDQVRTHTEGQAPGLYGEGLFEYFGLDKHVEAESCNAIRHGESIQIDIGKAQGVVVGAVYSIPTEARKFRLVEVDSVKPFTSTGVWKKRPYVPKSWPESETRRATLREWALDKKVHIHRSGDISGWHSLEAELVKRPGLALGTLQRQERDMVVQLDEEGFLQISQSGVLLKGLPKISVNDEHWPSKLIGIISHVGRFQELFGLYSSSGSSKFPKEHFEVIDDGQEVIEGNSAKISFRYKGPCSHLWVSLYNFSPSWAIRKISPSCGTSAERLEVTDGERELELFVNMTIPPECRYQDQDSTVDHFFWFISTSPSNVVPSWGGICLPPIRATRSLNGVVWKPPPVPESNNDEGDRDGEATAKPRTPKTAPPMPQWVAVGCSVVTKRAMQTKTSQK